MRLKLILSKMIDGMISLSTTKFVFNLISIDTSDLIGISIYLIASFGIFIINDLLTTHLAGHTLGEGLLQIEKSKKWCWPFSKKSFQPAKIQFLHQLLYSFSALILILAPIFQDSLIDEFGNQVTGLTKSNLKWTPYKHPDHEWKIEFPSTPSSKEKNIDLPDSNQLKLKETIAQEEDLFYSIATTSLPADITKWGSNLVLKGSMKILANNLNGAKTSTNKIFQYQNHPTLPYTITVEDKVIYGRLILIEDTLYKLEVECPLKEAEMHQHKLDKFFNSFVPS